ncbi:hypothetical protein [Spongiimicrobium salis]|uniref:hypothetical protein n=1 Tax=Spongiimicrobium salis TaxID=1667022 RepID=UPI00374CBD9E
MLRRKRLFKREVVFLGTRKENFKAAQGKVAKKKATVAQLQQIRKKITEQNRRIERRNFWVAFVLVLPLLFYIGHSIITSTHQEVIVASLEKEPTAQDMEKFYFFVEDANRWLSEQHWHNAIFQYKEALGICPDDLEIQQQLAAAYSYQCSLKNRACEEGLAYVNQLILKYPENLSLQDIKTIFLLR